MLRRLITASLVVCLFLAGPIVACSSFVAPTDAVRITPPEEWRQWFAEAEQCSGLHGDFDRIMWYVVLDDAIQVRGKEADGLHVQGPVVSRIYIVARIVYPPQMANALPHDSALIVQAWKRYQWQVVTHEELHELVNKPGQHPQPPFGTCVPYP